MPTYDYECQACHHTFEEFQSMTAKHLKKCPACGKMKLKRLIGTGAGVIFKGGGFYETDYRSESYKKDAEADKKSSEPKGDSEKSTSSDSADKSDKSDKTKSNGKAETKAAVKKDGHQSKAKTSKSTSKKKKTD